MARIWKIKVLFGWIQRVVYRSQAERNIYLNFVKFILSDAYVQAENKVFAQGSLFAVA